MVALDVHAAVPSLRINHNLGVLIIAQWTWPIADGRENVFVHKVAHMSDLVEAAWLDGRRPDQCVADLKRMLFFADRTFVICIAGRDNWDQDIATVAELHIQGGQSLELY